MAGEFFDPRFTPPAEGITYAPRPKRLEGLRIGIVDNGKSNAGNILKAIGEVLGERYRMEVVQISGKESPAHGVEPHAIDGFKSQADFVMAGVGD
ncbi:MAG: hypothetical protein HY423_07935 [Candidatus Lambdaproteobacteria bacterium]|nr:hypothetical protein [Candidatus Lambdaproteobacteria bacterium]